MAPINITKHLANIITLSNLVFGFLSLRFTMLEQYQMAALMILIAVVMDTLDGRIARHFDTVGEIGKNLDSLSDLVSFGVAPAMLAYAFRLQEYPLFGIAAAIIFCLAGAYRLARFNASSAQDYFVGVPITFAGGFVAILVFLGSYLPPWAWLAIILALAGFMVSYIKVPKTGTKSAADK